MKARREFIRSAAVAATIVLARPAFAALGPKPGVQDSAAAGIPSFATFQRLKGTKFRVSSAAIGHQWLELDEVLNVTRDRRLESISLRFKGDAALKLSEHMYRFAHRECGSFDFFISPGTSEDGRCNYRAVICRLV
jgi:hypothetical protein